MHRGLATLVLLAAWACCLAGGAAGQQQQEAAPLSTLYKCPIRESELFRSGCGRRCRHTTEAALRRIYNTLGGSDWNFEAADSGRPADNGGWGQCNHCALTRSHNDIPAGAILPSYCCWAGVFCCSEYVALQRDAATLTNSSLCQPYSVILLQLRSAGVAGNLSAVMRDLQLLHDNGLRQLDISRNNLVSTLPPELGNLKQLDALLLSSNYLTGTIPPSLGQLHQLQQLDLEFNLLKGRVTGLCSNNSSRLATLTLRANDFSGPLDLRRCRQLAMVDLSENGFSGSLPISGSNLLLSAFRARTNNFSGTIPDQVWELPLLMSLDLTSNSISGTLPQSVASTSYLMSLQLGSNLLYGTVPAGLAQSTALTVLDLSDNSWIVGTLPNMTWMLGLQALRVGNTRLQGTIPAELKDLPYLTSVDIHNTLMTCCGDEQDADAKAQQPGGLLPDYLAFSNTSAAPPSDEVMPRDPDFRQYMAVGDNMMCKTVVRDPAFPTAGNKLVLRPANLSAQAWVVDPEYYWFKECQCNPNYRKGSRIDRVFWCNVTSYLESGQPWDVAQHCVNMSVMTCTKDDGGVSREQAITIAVLGFAGLLLLVMITSLTLNMCFTRAGKVRRQLEAWRKHMAGMPKAGRMSIVITDIEGYSDLFKRCPEQMYKALTLHNNVIRRAKYNNCGSTVQQEGDSYTLVFHTAFDAVAFCLQTQQALMEVSWPEGLMAESSGGGGHKSGNKARRLKLPEFGDGGWRFRSRTKGQKSLRGSMKLSVISQGSLAPGGSAALEFPPSANGTAPGGSGSSHHCCQLSAAASAQHQQPGGSSRSRMRDLFLASSGGEVVMLFNGLRVRMGVVTGEVEKAEPGSNALQNIMNSSLYKLALDVSDAGNGGQIIVDEPTFARIKEELHPLGAVDGSGLNYNKLAQRTSLWHLLCLGTLWSRRRHDVLDCDEAVVLDMGEYQLPPSAPKVNSLGTGALTMMRASLKLPAALMLMPRGGAASPSPPTTSPTQQQQQQQQHRHTFSTGTDFGFDLDPTSSLPGAMPCDVVAAALRHQHGGGAAAAGSSSMLRQRVRLLQILAPSMVGRAAVWGNKLSLKASWECTDAPYFEAPGAREAPLGATGSLSSSSMQLIPRQQHHPPQQPQQQLQRLHSGGEQLSAASSYNSVDSGGVSAAVASSVASSAAAAAAVSAVSAGPPGVSFDIESQASLGDQQHQHQQSQLPPLYQPVPPVTMVFMVVEGAKVFGARKRQLLKDIHSHLAALLMEALRHVPGGYLCRMQEGDLKYMIAFASARSALEWCLLVQEAAMYLNWPDDTDRWHRNSYLRSEYDRSGALVFRGPRLKMGLCEGCPRTIIPDHLGRADYHGASVNQAARFMDAGAHGGQIACEAGLALAVLRQWAAPDDSSSLAGSDSLSPDVARTVSAPAATAAGAAAAAAMATGGSSSGAAAAGGGDTSLLLCDESADGTLRALTSKSLDSALTNSVVAAALGDPLLRPQLQQHLADTAAADDTSNGSSLSRLVSIGTPFCTAVPAAAAATSSDDAEAASSPAAASQQQQQQQLRFGPRSNSSAAVFAHRGSTVSANVVAGGGGSANGSTGRLSRFFARKQQSQQASHMALGSGLGHAVAAAAVGRVSAQEEQPRVFGLSDVPTAPAAVEVHALGLFKFKGSPAPIEMANVMLAALAGRTAFFPADPPKGKGGRVAARSGVLASGSAPLPTLALQYRSRVPDHILQAPTGAQLSGVHGSGPAWLRTNSLPARASQGFGDGDPPGRNSRSGSSSAVLLPSPGRQDAAGGSGGGGGDTGGNGSSGAVRFNMGIRSRSVVAPRSGSGSSGGQQQAAAEAMISLAVLRQQQQQLRLQREAAVSAGSGSACQRVTEEVSQA